MVIPHVTQPTVEDLGAAGVAFSPRPKMDLERKMEGMMAQKIDDALTKMKDRRRQMVLDEDPFVPKIMAVPLLKSFK